jgi:steroid 5-alpha reductase family enzyme
MIQNLVLLAIALPAWIALRRPRAPLGVLDAVAAAVILLGIVGGRSRSAAVAVPVGEECAARWW